MVDFKALKYTDRAIDEIVSMLDEKYSFMFDVLGMKNDLRSIVYKQISEMNKEETRSEEKGLIEEI